MNIGAQTWFYWPITVAVSATVTGVLLYRRAARNERPALLSALGGVVALALPVVPLALATRARCNDTGQRTLFEPNWVFVGLGLAGWAIALWMLYRFAGRALGCSNAVNACDNSCNIHRTLARVLGLSDLAHDLLQRHGARVALGPPWGRCRQRPSCGSRDGTMD